MMSEEERKNMNVLDEAAEKAGGYVLNMVHKDTQYDLRKLVKYCKNKGIEPIDLTLRELNNFIIQ